MEKPTLDLVAVLGDYMVEQEEQRQKNGRIYASELGVALGPELDGCTLGFWLKCKDEPRRDRTPGEILMTQAGELLHDYLSKAIAAALVGTDWWVVSVETRVHIEAHGEEIGSRLDVKIAHISGHTIVIDIKTKRGAAFKFLNEPKPGNVLQVQAYIKGEDADEGGLLYVDREGQNFMKYFEVTRADDEVEDAILTLKNIRDNPVPPNPVSLRLNIKENKGPDSLYLKVPWQIDWCDLKQCACAKALPAHKDDIPTGIVAKIHEAKDDGPDVLIMSEGEEKWEPIVRDLLAKAGRVVRPKQED